MRYGSSILSSSLGNILEWYDFGLFSIFSSLFSRLFFPTADPELALLATFSIFAIGFFCRPVGALLFGYLGDRKGRAQTLRLSILMISLPTLLIGCLPTYQQMGSFAPLLLTFVRMWQGISIGGEYSGNLIYLAETAPSHYRATFTSLACMGSNLGVLLAAIVGVASTYFFTDQELVAWGWRVPYLISGLLSILIYLFRLRIHETGVFEYLKKHELLTDHPIKTALTKNYWQILRTLGLVCMGSTFYYFCFTYIPVFLTQDQHFSIQRISILMACLVGSMIILVPLSGFLCDRIGRRKMLLFNAVFILLIVVPGFYLLHFTPFTLLVSVLAVFTLGSSLEQGTTPVALIENFPPPARYTGVSLGYNIGNGLLSGTLPMVCEWLVGNNQSSLAPAFYIAFCAAITGTVVFFFVPETRGKSLRTINSL